MVEEFITGNDDAGAAPAAGDEPGPRLVSDNR